MEGHPKTVNNVTEKAIFMKKALEKAYSSCNTDLESSLRARSLRYQCGLGEEPPRAPIGRVRTMITVMYSCSALESYVSR